MFKCFQSIPLLGLILLFNSMFIHAQDSAVALVDGETLEIEVDGADELHLTYEAEAGDVITLVVDAQNDTDTRMTLYNAAGDEIASDDNSGSFLNPALIRIVLADDGSYHIVISHYNTGEALVDEFEITLYEVELLNLNLAPQSVILGDEFELDRMVFEAEAEQGYLVFIRIADSYDSVLYISIFDESDPFAIAQVEMTGTQSAAVRIEVSQAALLSFELEYLGFNEELEVSLEIEAES